MEKRYKKVGKRYKMCPRIPVTLVQGAVKELFMKN